MRLMFNVQLLVSFNKCDGKGGGGGALVDKGGEGNVGKGHEWSNAHFYCRFRSV